MTMVMIITDNNYLVIVVNFIIYITSINVIDLRDNPNSHEFHYPYLFIVEIIDCLHSVW